MAVELPEHIAEQTRGLGEPVARFRSSAVQSVLYLVVGLLAVALGVGAFVFLVIGLVDPPERGFRPIRTSFLGFLLLSAGAGMVMKWRGLRGTGVVVFDRGLAHLRGVRCEVMRWEEITAVGRGVPPGNDQFTVRTPSRLALTSADGRAWVLTETLSGLKELRAIVEERTLPRLAAAAREALEGGKTLSFGDIGLKQEGLTYPGGGILHWELVAEAGLANGMVVVLSKVLNQPYCQVPLYQVPNAHLLLALVDYFRPAKA
jgi:hypothetical protein